MAKKLKTSQGASSSSSEYCFISKLPDVLLISFLDFLDAKQAVQSSKISKKFRSLWKDVSSIDIRVSKPVAPKGFVDRMKKGTTHGEFVTEFLNLNRSTLVSKLCLDCGDAEISLVKEWMENIAKRKLIELQVQLPTDFRLTDFPRHLFHLSCSSLVKLELSNITMDLLNDAVCLPNLKFLRLEWVTILDGSAIDRMLLGCPAVVCLVIGLKKGLPDVHIRSKSVKTLEVDAGYNGNYNIVIECPCLEAIAVRDHTPLTTFTILKAPDSFVTTSVAISHERNAILKEVALGHELIYKVAALRPNDGYLLGLPMLSNITQLTITDPGSIWEVINFMDHTPNVTTVHVKQIGFSTHFHPQPEIVSYCLASSLRSIQLTSSISYYSMENLIRPLSYILLNGSCLESLSFRHTRVTSPQDRELKGKFF